jgi:hypothetical protein
VSRRVLAIGAAAVLLGVVFVAVWLIAFRSAPDGSHHEGLDEIRAAEDAYPAASGTTPNPCALVPHAELVTVLGGEPERRRTRNNPATGSRRCLWFKGRRFLDVMVTPKSQLGTSLIAGMEPTVRVSGIAPFAFYFTRLKYLVAWAKGYSVSVDLYSKMPRPKETTVHIAAVVVARL